MSKLLIKDGQKSFLVKNPDQDIHTQYGFIRANDLKKKPGTVLKTNKDVELTLIEPGFLDKIKKIKRGAQVIPLKDIGSIIIETGLGKDSTVLDAGAGSGYLSLIFGNFVKKVFAYEIREDHAEIVKKNIEYMDAKNIKLIIGDVFEGIKQKNLDLINLDLPDPWRIFENELPLKVGGYLVSYSPTVPQIIDFVNAMPKNFIYLKTIEIIEREWEVKERKVRPKSQAIGHSGFITIMRKIS